MKKLMTCAALSLSVLASQAQQAAGPLSSVFTPRRIVKTNLIGYAFLAVNANFEQKVGAKTSVGLLGGYKIPTTITLDAIGQLDGEDQTYTGEIEPEGLFLNPYFRFYTGKAMTGFYLEAFTRYYSYTFLIPYDYEKDNKTIRANLDGSATGFGGGLALGGQFALAKRVYLDLNLGLGIASGDLHAQTNDPNLDANDFQKIKRNIDMYAEDADVSIFLLDNTLKNLKADANASSAWGDIQNQIFPLTRAGISIGYAF